MLEHDSPGRGQWLVRKANKFATMETRDQMAVVHSGRLSFHRMLYRLLGKDDD